MVPPPMVAPQMQVRAMAGTISEFCDRWWLAGAPDDTAFAHGRLASAIEKPGSQLGVDVVVHWDMHAWRRTPSARAIGGLGTRQ